MKNFKDSLKLKFGSDGRPLGFGEDPHADWKVIFIITAALTAIITALNIWTFIAVKNTEKSALGNPTESGVQALDLDKLRNTVFYYQNKAAEFEAIKSGTSSTVVDPSI